MASPGSDTCADERHKAFPLRAKRLATCVQQHDGRNPLTQMLLSPHHFMSTLTKPLNHGWRRVAGMCLLCAAWLAAVLRLPAATATPLPLDTLGTAEVVASAWLRGMRSAAPLQHLE